MDSKPKWREVTLPHGARIPSEKEYDVIIVGGGITGATTAYLMLKRGKKVCLIERGRLGGVESSHTTAHLTYVTDIRIADLERKFGRKQARLAWQAGQRAINLIEQIVRDENLECEFRRVPGYLLPSLLPEQANGKTADDFRLAAELGFGASSEPKIPFFNSGGSLFKDQALFHPQKFISGLLSAIRSMGGEVLESTEASEFDGEKLTVTAGTTEIRASYFVIATHVPLVGINSMLSSALLQTKLSAVSTYAIGARIPAGLIAEASYWDLNDPYYYLRIDRRDSHDYAIFGGQDHKTGQVSDTNRRYDALEMAFRSIVPAAEIDTRWSGQVIETNDGLPFIGEIADKQFLATGFAGNGMTFGVVAAEMACDAVAQRPNEFSDLFDPHRFKVMGGTLTYLKQNADYPYYLIRDRLSAAPEMEGEVPDPGKGRVVKINGKKAACYCDENGNLFSLSAVCPHMGGIVHWNQAEKTWDCPCHGSRFHGTGEVLTGPAESPLSPLGDVGEGTVAKNDTLASTPGSLLVLNCSI